MCKDSNVKYVIIFRKICFSDSKSKKSVAYNYACILILLVVQSSSDVQMLEQYSAPLLKLCKADENNTKLQGTVCAVNGAVAGSSLGEIFLVSAKALLTFWFLIMQVMRFLW